MYVSKWSLNSEYLLRNKIYRSRGLGIYMRRVIWGRLSVVMVILGQMLTITHTHILTIIIIIWVIILTVGIRRIISEINIKVRIVIEILSLCEFISIFISIPLFYYFIIFIYILYTY